MKRHGNRLVIFGSTLAAVVAGVYLIGLDTADQVASVVGALFGGLALYLTLSELRRRRNEQPAGTIPSARLLHPVSDEPLERPTLDGPAGRLETRNVILLAAALVFALFTVRVSTISLFDASGPDDSVGPAGTTCAASGTGAVALVVGARANVPRPTLTAEVRSLLSAHLAAGEQIYLIRLDGHPTLAGTLSITPAKSARNHDLEVKNTLSDLDASLAGLRAIAPEADVLAGLSIGARAVGDRGTIVLMDSGLQTVAPLDFVKPGVVEAGPSEVSSFLRSEELLPPLSGRGVILVGVGDVAAPQQPLNDRQRRNLVDIWRQIAVSAGASCVQILDTPLSGDAPVDAPAVATISLPEQQSLTLTCGSDTTLTTQAISFHPDSAVLRDPEEAKATLGALAKRINSGKLTVEVIGMTDSIGSSELKVTLSYARAKTVRDQLIKLRVSPDTITSRGEGDTVNAIAPGNQVANVRVKC
ncbi:OmpA family protein [Micromonospora sp. NPDC047793]|uniref:OmpA family protein n=1 Tax=Micromonospora sp. NPDC047793 TaxID=3154342 RepID=UPI0033D9F0CF